MGTSNGYHGLHFRGVMLLLFYGSCVLSDENTNTEHRAVGNSLIVPLGFQSGSVSFAQWRYKGKIFAEFQDGNIRITEELQFSGRLKVNSNLSVEVRDLQLQDSGRYSVVADKPGGQLPTKTISLTVYDVLKTEIESNQTWSKSTNSCEVRLLCRAHGDQDLSYRWSGFKTGSGAELSFSLSTAEGAVSLTCTVFGSFNNVSNTARVTCRPSETPAGTDNSPNVYIWFAAGGGAAVFLLIAIITVSCWWKSHNADRCAADSGNTVYADVNPEATVRKDKRSESINVGSVYETVDDLRITPVKPQTVYDTVIFGRPPPGIPSAASSYQAVL